MTDLILQRMFQYNIIKPVKDESGKYIENAGVNSPEFILYLTSYIQETGAIQVPRILKAFKDLGKPMPDNKELALHMIHYGIISYLGHQLPSKEDMKMFDIMAEIIEEHYFSCDLEEFRH